ncbi:MAG TPA: FIST N-terminal domain-containing protein [Verrucomicrobiae bacterium]|nr:FIST N-terminal domain-containing protein [Verrucomicrobiae bacterium]
MLAQNEHSVAGHWSGEFDEPSLQGWVEQLRARLTAPKVSLGLVFMSPQFFPHARQVLEILRVHGRIPLLAGCSSTGLIAGGEELESNPGIALALYSLPDAELKAFHFQQGQVDEANGPGYWPMETGLNAEQTNGWLVFADPFHLDCENWLRSWNEAYAPLPVFGGLASGDPAAQLTQVYLDGEVFEEGGVAISIGGGVKMQGVISQGCTPIGETWTLTRADGNLIHEIGNRPAYEILAETFNSMSTSDQKKSRGNLFIGLVVNEYLEDFHRGDFLVRALIGADPRSGDIAVGAVLRPGQTVQFHRRDAQAATEDLLALLGSTRKQLAGAVIYGGCLCSCNGRGQGLFGSPNHDAQMIQEQLGPLGLAGFFCNGEIGPVGQLNFLHGYTASLALFVKKDNS